MSGRQKIEFRHQLATAQDRSSSYHQTPLSEKGIMKMAQVDILGFQLDLDIIQKEFLMTYGSKSNHFLFKPAQPYKSLESH